MRIIDCEQGSPEWFAARLGIPTASEFKTLLSGRKEAKDKKTRATYMMKLAGEIITGEPMESYSNVHMERGKVQEDEARDLYAFMMDVDPIRVGFIRTDSAGASPDSLIGEKRGLEIKTALPHIQIERLKAGVMPPEHKAQVQGNLWISGREVWDFVSYCPKLPMLCVPVERDEKYIAEIATAVDEFNAELAQTVEFIRQYGRQKEAA